MAGFLIQILRSLQLGMSLSASFALDGGDVSTMTLTLEPDDAGDIRVDDRGVPTIEQVKIRASHRRWTTGTVARDVLPDLVAGARPREEQRFQFTTNNLRGLEALEAYLHHRARLGAAPAAFAWGGRRLSPEAFLDGIADAAGMSPSDPHLLHVLDNLKLVHIDVRTAEREVEARLAPMLGPGEDIVEKRCALMGRLFEEGSAGRTLDVDELLRLVGRDALLRLRHAATVPALSLAAARRDCVTLGYDADAQARLTPIEAADWFIVLSGDSGQGKTWSLCQAALDEAEGRAVVVATSASSVADVVDAVNDRLWRPAFETDVPLRVMARRLGRDLAPDGGHWLTVYVDDVQDRDFARSLARQDWAGLGVRVVVTCQPRITIEIVRSRPDARVVTVSNFTSAELRRYLRHHGRQDSLEMMPDDVFELLRKPVHARVYVDLPVSEGWVDATEYELFKSYWDEATGMVREQYDHPYDRLRLANLAGSLLGERPAYPWSWRDLEDAGIDEEAIRRLEVVGLLRRPASNQIVFSTDRMLNWAVAEHLVALVAVGELDAHAVDAIVDGFDNLVDAAGTAIGRRLGYVFHDLVWLLLRKVGPDFVADLIRAHVADTPHEWRGESRWRQLGTVGPDLLPALENLARREYDEDQDWYIPHHIPAAIVAAAMGEPAQVEDTVRRLLDAGREREAKIALRVAALIPLPGVLDRLFEVHVQRAIDLDSADDVDGRGDAISRYNLSIEALKRAAGASPIWLDARIGAETRVPALEQLLWCLNDDTYMAGGDARPIWARRQDHVLAMLPSDSKALIGSLGHFDAVDRRGHLDAVSPTRDDWMSSRLLKARARIDPEAALEQVRTSTDEYGWSASDWWLPELHRYDAERLSQALRENVAGRLDRGDELMHYYYNQPELMDRETLEIVLDDCTAQLRRHNDTNTPDDQAPHPPRRIIGFLCRLTEPFQFEMLHQRAGTDLEGELLRYASSRSGRSSRLTDTEGNECERVLAMIDGAGHGELVVAELRRQDGFGREDGYIRAHWSDADAVSAVLDAEQMDDGADGYRQVLRMEALAIHCMDAAIERMLRRDAPVYVAPAEMRSSAGRDLEGLRVRVAKLLAIGSAEDLAIAADLAGFLRDPEDARPLLGPLLDPATPTDVRQSIVGTMKALEFYDPSLLPTVRGMLSNRHDNEAWFLTAYLSECGDAGARGVVAAWLDALDLAALSTARAPTLHALLQHADSRGAVIRFHRRMSERGHRLLDTDAIVLLAGDGDELAREMLVNAAYRGPDGFDIGPVSGILHLLETDPDEAYFASTRLLARHQRPEAVRLLFRIDRDRAWGEMLPRYRRFPPSLRAEIGRNVRAHVSADAVEQALGALAVSSDAADRRTAAELAGWMPPATRLPWLSGLVNDEDATVRNEAIDALRRRRLELAALGHLATLPSSAKHLQWARLQTLFDLVDPRFLWTQGDQLSLGPFLKDAPHEFWVEAKKLKEKREKAVGDAEKKADDKAD